MIYDYNLGSGWDHGWRSLGVAIIRKYVTISTCWGVFWFFCSICWDGGFSIPPEWVCTWRPCLFCTSPCVFWYWQPFWWGSRCLRGFQERNLSQLIFTIFLEQPDDLLASEQLDAGDCFLVSNGDADLGWGHALLGHGDDKLTDALGSVGNPLGTSPLEGGHSRTDALSLSFALHSAHGCWLIGN